MPDEFFTKLPKEYFRQFSTNNLKTEIMLKNISNLKGAQALTNDEQKTISGGKRCINPSHQTCSDVVGCPVYEICLLDTTTQAGICICN